MSDLSINKRAGKASALAVRSTSAWSSNGANMNACASVKRASSRQRRCENMSASEAGKHAFGKRPNSANVRKSAKEDATAQS